LIVFQFVQLGTCARGGQSVLDGTTGSDGRVLFDNIIVDDYTFSATMAGYVSGVGSGKAIAGERARISLEEASGVYRDFLYNHWFSVLYLFLS
jgi:hypothetical protein